MTAIQAERAINEVLRDMHLASSQKHKSVADGVKTMIYTSNFYPSDLVKAFIKFCKTGVLDMTKVSQVTL